VDAGAPGRTVVGRCGPRMCLEQPAPIILWSGRGPHLRNSVPG
jgi:hypothetical protein